MKKTFGIIIAVLIVLAFLAPLLRGTPRLVHGSDILDQSETTVKDYHGQIEPLAAALMGDLYFKGDEVAQDREKAEIYYAQAAQAGHVRSQSIIDQIKSGKSPEARSIDSSEDLRELGAVYNKIEDASTATGKSITDALNEFEDIVAPMFESTREMMVFQGKVLPKALETIDASDVKSAPTTNVE